MRTKLFLGYSHRDAKWQERIAVQLRVLECERFLDLFIDTRIGVGSDWHQIIHENLLAAKVALLLISADFLVSDYVRETEVPALLEKHRESGLIVFPLLVRDCPWQSVPWLARLQMRPTDGRAVNELPAKKVDRQLANVAREIRDLLPL